MTTIQSILSKYPKVEKAFIESQSRSDGTIAGYGLKDAPYYVNTLAPFNTLKGHVEAFFRGHGITLPLVEEAVMNELYFAPEWCLFFPDEEYEKTFQYHKVGNDVLDYETAFLSALEKAAEYLEGKL